MAKKIAGIEQDVIVTGGLLVGGYFLVKNLLPDLLPNLGVSDADRSVLDTQQTQPDSLNIFSSNYPGANDYFNNVIFDQYEKYQVNNDTDYWNAVRRAYLNGQLSPTDPIYPIFQIYSGLESALIGHIISGNQDDINYYLNQITNKSQIGVLNSIFMDLNYHSFWDLLRKGWFTEMYGLNGTDLADQVRRLNNLPE